MQPIPMKQETVMLRTDFSDQNAWEKLCTTIHEQGPEDQAAFGQFADMMSMIGQPMGEAQASVDPVDDPQYEGVTTEQLLGLVSTESGHTFIFVADAITMSHPDSPILVVDLCEEPGRSFRTVPSEIIGIESNLSLANMDWEEFAECTDGEGIYRGFE